MAYNQPYGMPYGFHNNYPYGNVQMPQQPYIQPQVNQQMQQPQQQAPQQSQPQYSNNFYSVVNGLDDAKQYAMLPNQTMLLMDSNKPILYKKTANGLGQTTIECFKMVAISEQEAMGNSEPQNQPKIEYASKEDLNSLTRRFDNLVDKLYGKREKSDGKPLNTSNKGGNE